MSKLPPMPIAILAKNTYCVDYNRHHMFPNSYYLDHVADDPPASAF